MCQQFLNETLPNIHFRGLHTEDTALEPRTKYGQGGSGWECVQVVNVPRAAAVDCVSRLRPSAAAFIGLRMRIVPVKTYHYLPSLASLPFIPSADDLLSAPAATAAAASDTVHKLPL